VLTDEELGQGGYRFKDLQALRIVENRTDLNRKQKKLGFPKPVKTGESQALFLKVEVHAWLRERAALRPAPIPIPEATLRAAPIPEAKHHAHRALKVTAKGRRMRAAKTRIASNVISKV
jgi:hypothetical protein